MLMLKIWLKSKSDPNGRAGLSDVPPPPPPGGAASSVTGDPLMSRVTVPNVNSANPKREKTCQVTVSKRPCSAWHSRADTIFL